MQWYGLFSIITASDISPLMHIERVLPVIAVAGRVWVHLLCIDPAYMVEGTSFKSKYWIPTYILWRNSPFNPHLHPIIHCSFTMVLPLSPLVAAMSHAYNGSIGSNVSITAIATIAIAATATLVATVSGTATTTYTNAKNANIMRQVHFQHVSAAVAPPRSPSLSRNHKMIWSIWTWRQHFTALSFLPRRMKHCPGRTNLLRIKMHCPGRTDLLCFYLLHCWCYTTMTPKWCVLCQVIYLEALPHTNAYLQHYAYCTISQPYFWRAFFFRPNNRLF